MDNLLIVFYTLRKHFGFLHTLPFSSASPAVTGRRCYCIDLHRTIKITERLKVRAFNLVRKMKSVRYYFYHETKKVCENRHRQSYIAWHYFKLASYIYFMLRLFYVIYKLSDPNIHTHKKDVIARLFTSSSPIQVQNIEKMSPGLILDPTNFSLAVLDDLEAGGPSPEDSVSSNNDKLFIATIAFLMACSAGLEYKIYFSRVDTIVFQMFYDFVVRLRKFYIRCRLSEPERTAVLEQTMNMLMFSSGGKMALPGSRRVRKLKAQVLIRHKHAYYDAQKLAMAPLIIYPDMSLKLRFKMMKIMDYVENANFLQVVTVYLGLFIFVVYHSINLILSVNHLSVLLPLLELFFLGLVLSFVIMLLILMSNLAFTSSMIFIAYIREVNHKLFDATQDTRKLAFSTGSLFGDVGPSTSRTLEVPHGGEVTRHSSNSRMLDSRLVRSQKLLAKVFKHFNRTHVTIAHQIQFANREEWSTVLVISILNHLPINAYLLYRAITGTGTIVSTLLLVAQWVFLLVVLCFLAYYSSVLHKSHPTLFALQMFLSRYNILVKYKTLRMYELLNNRRKIGITIGPSQTIAYTFVLEILIVYIGIVLYTFKTMKKFS